MSTEVQLNWQNDESTPQRNDVWLPQQWEREDTVTVSTTEIILISAIVLLVFGASWLPALSNRAGRATAQARPVIDQVQTVRAAHARVDRQVRRVARIGRHLP